MSDNEKKVKQYIKKLEKIGKTLSDVTDKSINQLKNNNAFKAFEKQVKRALERDKIIEQNRKYDEKIKAKREKANDEIFRQFPWVKKVMKFDSKYKNVKDAKTVYERKMNEEKLEINSTLGKYFNKRNKNLRELQKAIKDTKDIEVLRNFNEALEYIIEAYGTEDDNGGFSFKYSDDEVIERIHTNLRIKQLEFNKFGKG